MAELLVFVQVSVQCSVNIPTLYDLVDQHNKMQ